MVTMSFSSPSRSCEDEEVDEELEGEPLGDDEELDGLLSSLLDGLLSELEGLLSVFDEELLSLLLDGWFLLVASSFLEELSFLLSVEDEAVELFVLLVLSLFDEDADLVSSLFSDVVLEYW